ncbi:MAG: signal transduction histidine kinase [Myxococcota bacterium]|jgi:signal transduction histidine kinase
MTPAEDLAQLLAFFRIEADDLEALAELRPVFELHSDAMVERFYEHLDRFQETREMLADSNVRDRLRTAQRAYLMSLTDPVIDLTYLEQRSVIGMVHEKVGLNTRWYLGAYSLYFGTLMPLIADHLGDDSAAMQKTIIALEKRLLFDAELAIRQYIDRRELELRTLNQQLRAEGKSLTQEVEETHDDLRKSEVRAQAAEQLASTATLISGLAHEIGTPMGVIRGHAEALGGAVEGERASWRLNMILEQIDRITGIIQALLNMARPRETLRTAVDLRSSLDDTLGFLTEKIRQRQVLVTKDYAEIETINADSEKLQQVFLNLLINAVDAMPNGGDLALSIVESDTGVRIHIRDTGSGMSPAELRSVFDPFFTTKAAGRGNGLGLVVVKGILDEHEASIQVTSEPGVGTEFTLEFPYPS